MATIATHELRKIDVPDGKFNWAAFSEFAFTFDPLSEAPDEFNQALTGAAPSDIWTKAALRYFLYCCQRIANNQGGLTQGDIDKAQTAMNILRAKI
jgi:hypothetical protein